MSIDTSFQDLDTTFHDLKIGPEILDVLDRQGFSFPSFIQAQAIPPALAGQDILGIAQTGTGKTLAFAIPMIQRLMSIQGRGLVLVPTRELAVQIHETFKKVGHPLGFHCAVLIGGEDIRIQKKQLDANPRIIIATPGRLIDHMKQQITRMDDAIVVVLDEADRMLDMGFIPQVELIFKYVCQYDRQTMLFSATMPDAIVDISAKHMNKPVRIEIARESTLANNITQELYIVNQVDKNKLLEKLLHQYKGSVLLFSRTKIGAAKLAKYLKSKHFKAAEIHSDKSQDERFAALEGFKKGTIRILVATDIAARGIDVKDISLVVNYDLPDDPSNYVHRIGRTGRAGKSGHALTFACPDQSMLVHDIEKAINAPLPIVQHTEMTQEYFVSPKKIIQEKARRSARRHR
jgi:ATP-dependent RNA helicase RhlE